MRIEFAKDQLKCQNVKQLASLHSSGNSADVKLKIFNRRYKMRNYRM